MVDYEVNPVDQPSTYGLFSDVRRACDAWFRRREAQEGRERFVPFQGWTMAPKSDWTPPVRPPRPKMSDEQRKAKINAWRLTHAEKIKAQNRARNKKAYSEMTDEQRAKRREEMRRWRGKNRERYNESQRALAAAKVAAMTPEERTALYKKQSEYRRAKKERQRNEQA
jgi:hypothetical protein